MAVQLFSRTCVQPRLLQGSFPLAHNAMRYGVNAPSGEALCGAAVRAPCVRAADWAGLSALALRALGACTLAARRGRQDGANQACLLTRSDEKC